MRLLDDSGLRASRIQTLTESDITRLFNEKVVASLYNMLNGRISCHRFELWNGRSALDGYRKMEQLRNLNVVKPFTETQGNFVLALLENEFVSSNSNSLEMGVFLTYVLLPECLIRIYGEVNGRSFDQAEDEMRQ